MSTPSTQVFDSAGRTFTCMSCGGKGPARAYMTHQCNPKGVAPVPAAEPTVATAKPDGLESEVLLALQLDEAGLKGWIRQYAWALDATPSRKFAADFAYPVARLLVEIKGSAHRVTLRKVYEDCEREALAAALGWRVLPVHRGMVRDGMAVHRIRQA